LRVESAFILIAHWLASSGALRQVVCDIRLVPKKVAQHGVNVGQREGRVLLRDFFCGSTVPKSFHHGIQRHASTAQAENAFAIRVEGNGLVWLDCQAHSRNVWKMPQSANETFRERLAAQVDCAIWPRCG